MSESDGKGEYVYIPPIEESSKPRKTDDVVGTKADEERIERWPREQRRRGNLRIRTGGTRIRIGVT